ncbi:MAG: VanZ family protein [Oscillospiraceae bacterium]|jgi:glycopeptide antibiotics resistance protein|nr:VanZ family protein [Oscillospiraceae bacterium]
MRILLAYAPWFLLCAFVSALAATAVFVLRRRPAAGRAVLFFLCAAISVLYAVAACFLLFSKRPPAAAQEAGPFYGNFVPLKTILESAASGRHMQNIGNVAIFIPLPFVVYFALSRHGFKRAAVVSLAITLIIEPVQLLINLLPGATRNIIDIDDLLLNALGCILGLLVLKSILTLRAAKKHIGSPRNS